MLRNKKKYMLIFFIIIIFLLIIIGIYGFSGLNKKDSNLEFIRVLGYNLNEQFNPDIYEYHVEVNDKFVDIMCNIDIEGCNTTIELQDNETYYHKITYDDGKNSKLYTLIIHNNTMGESDKNLLIIKNISGNPTEWTNQDIKLTVNLLNDQTYKYSIDNGSSWQDSNEFIISENGLYQIMTKNENGTEYDFKNIKVDKIDKEIPAAFITKKLKNGQVSLNVNVNDDISGFDSVSFNGGEYTKNLIYTVKNAGNYYFQIKDKAGNISDKIYVNVNASDFDSKVSFENFTITLDGNGSTVKTKYLTCENGQDKCEVTLPEIFTDKEVIGWSEDKNAKTSQYKVGEKIKITNNKVLYAITKKTLTATFNKNGATNISATKESCNVYNKEISCKIKTPTIERNGYIIIGWGLGTNSITESYKQNESITLFNNASYYAVTRKTVAAIFNKNGATNMKLDHKNCNIYNNSTSCEVITPTIERNGYTILGWGEKSSSHVPVVGLDKKISINADVTYYAITKKTVTATFEKNGATSIGATKKSCDIYNNEFLCNITAPTIQRDGYNLLGWAESATTNNSKYNIGETILISSDVTYYAITTKSVIINFEKNGATNIGTTIQKCQIYNNDNSCFITLPKIERNGYEIIGWSEKSNGVTSSLKVGSNVKVDNNQKYYAITKKTVTATFNKNGATSIGATNKSCDIYNTAKSCTILTPTITRNGYTIVGWGSSSGTHTAQFKVNQNVSVTNNTNYYAITKKKVTATFEKNGATSIGATTKSCDIYNNDQSCNITTPTIMRSGYTILGWGTVSNAKTSTHNVDKSLALTNNIKLYALTKKTLTATFEKNGATSIGATTKSCDIYNNDQSCDITMPTITRNGYTILGWGSSANSKISTQFTNQTIPLLNNHTYYAVTSKKLTATFYNSNLSYIEKKSDSCTIYNKETSCNIVLPYYNRTGRYSHFWSLHSEAMSDMTGKTYNKEYFYKSGYSYTLTKDVTMYPNSNHISFANPTSTTHKYRAINVGLSKKIGETIFEFESGIPTDYLNSKFIPAVEEIYKIMPWVFIRGKVFVMKTDTYNAHAYALALSHSSNYSQLIIDLPYNIDKKNIIINGVIHEMAHGWDKYFEYKLGSKITDTEDFDKFYNLVKAKLTDESYGKLSKVETFASMYSNYFWHVLGYDKKFSAYVESGNPWYGLTNRSQAMTTNEQNELKKLIEKYAEISKNGYKK